MESLRAFWWRLLRYYYYWVSRESVRRVAHFEEKRLLKSQEGGIRDQSFTWNLWIGFAV
jgi:hypothetical protein